MKGILADVRSSFRSMVRRPGAFVAAILSLSLAIGLTTTILGITRSLLLDPLSDLQRPDRLITLHRQIESSPDELQRFSYPDFSTYAELDAFSGLAAYAGFELVVEAGGGSRQLDGLAVSPNFFDVLGTSPASGRGFGPDDDGRSVVVVGHDLWRRMLEADPRAIGASIRVNGEPLEVVGIAPAGFSGVDRSQKAELWLPLRTFERLMTGAFATLEGHFDRRQEWLAVVGRLEEGVSPDAAQARVDARSNQLRQQFPEWNAGESALVLPATQTAFGAHARDAVRWYALLLGAIAAVALLIGCLNASNLLLLIGLARQRDTAIRVMLGARPLHVVRLVWLEATVVFGTSTLGGLLLAYFALPLFEKLVFPGSVRLDLDLEPSTISATVVAAAIAGLSISLLVASRRTRHEPATVLREEVGLPTGRGARMQTLSVVLQSSLAVATVISAALVSQTMENLQDVEIGFRPERVLVASLDLAGAGYQPYQAVMLHDRLASRLLQLPAVEAAGFVAGLPLVDRATVEIDLTIASGARELGAKHVMADDGFFDALGLRPLAGTLFGDTPGARGIVVVNRALARALGDEQSVVGRELTLQPGAPPFEIVGVVPDVAFADLREPSPPMLYLHRAQAEMTFAGTALVGQLGLIARTRPEPQAVIPDLTAIVQELDRKLPVGRTVLLEELLADDLALERQTAWLLAMFGLVSLGLALAGLYGLVSHAVARRRREIGIRRALGAARLEILRTLVVDASGPVTVGVALGVLLAAAGTTLLRHLLFGVGRLDPPTYIAVALIVTGAAVVAVVLAARGALRIEPLSALKS